MNIILQAILGIIMALGFTFAFAMLASFLGRLAAKGTKYSDIS